MAVLEDRDLVDRFQEFYRTYYDDAIGDLAQGYPTDRRSLHVSWRDLFQFDPDLADDYLDRPDETREYAEEALRLYDLPVDVKLGRAHVRLHDLDDATEIRDIRAEHVNTMVAVHGIVRKATGVRPKVEEAAFECRRCGARTHVPQPDGEFREPHECEACERQGPFRLDEDQSEFVDAQTLRVQESPEGLRGGETPESIDVHIEDDICGAVSPGDRVVATGVLRLENDGGGDSPVFDIYMQGRSIEIEDEEFEDMDITEEEIREIEALAASDDLYERMVDSIAPSIYGYRQEKRALLFQLFSGVTKHLPDETRVRGDLHMLLIGDPGTGKCVRGDTAVRLADGSRAPIRELVERNLDDPTPVDDGVYDDACFRVASAGADGTIEPGRAVRVWKREAPDRLCRIRTDAGHEVVVTPSHPLFVQSRGEPVPTTADELSPGDFVAVPQAVSDTTADATLDVDFRRSRAPNAVRLNPPDAVTPALARLLGYVVAEGWATFRDDSTGDLRITNNDRAVLDDIAAAFEQLGVPYTETEPRRSKSAKTIRCTAGELVGFLEAIEPALLRGSGEQRVPDVVMRAPRETKSEFLKAYVEGKATLSTSGREICVASMSRPPLEAVRSMLLSFGIRSQLHDRRNGSYRLRISGEDCNRYRERIGFVTDRKARAAAAFGGTNDNTNTDVVPNLADDLRRVREALELSQADCGLPRTTYQHYERGDRNPSRRGLRRIVAAFDRRVEWLRETQDRVANGSWSDVEAVRRELNIPQEAIDVTQTAVSYYERNDAVPDGGRSQSAKLAVLDRIDDALDVADDVDSLRALAAGDIGWTRIESIEPIEPDDDWVYDLEVEGEHNYVADGVVSHNSQLLQYVQHISPRSVYTSGKGSSSAGLTAAAVKDDFGDGQQWSLEAGALVLADRGVAAVDELDKMDAGDRSAMHEALEQQQVSIAKAGINATLKSRCSLLGAANPKYGRFDQYEPIGEQIELEPALISRFDLIFTVTDEPDEEEDRALAEHILQTNYAGELNTQRTELQSANVTRSTVEAANEDIDPDIDAELLRKYVAYAKRNSFPSMTDGARDAIREFYVGLRSQGADEDQPVPVTARKLEALVRLAEASARVRLSDYVEEEDAERVIKIVRSCLEDIGVDPETGELDADVVETGTTKSQRDRIQNLTTIIDDLEAECDGPVPIDDVIETATDAGMDESKAEHEIEKLKQSGEIYEPQQNRIRTT